jgi:hypothetical protein
VSYDGQYTVDIAKTGSDFAMDLFGLTVADGSVFNFASSPRVNFSFIEGPKVFTASGGTVKVNSATASKLNVTFANVLFTPNGEGATGSFIVNGTVDAPVAAL